MTPEEFNSNNGQSQAPMTDDQRESKRWIDHQFANAGKTKSELWIESHVKIVYIPLMVINILLLTLNTWTFCEEPQIVVGVFIVTEVLIIWGCIVRLMGD